MATMPSQMKGLNFHIHSLEKLQEASELTKLRICSTKLELCIAEVKLMERTDSRAVQLGNLCLQLSDYLKAITELTLVKLAPQIVDEIMGSLPG
jgi:hypothetical protein